MQRLHLHDTDAPAGGVADVLYVEEVGFRVGPAVGDAEDRRIAKPLSRSMPPAGSLAVELPGPNGA